MTPRDVNTIGEIRTERIQCTFKLIDTLLVVFGIRRVKYGKVHAGIEKLHAGIEKFMLAETGCIKDIGKSTINTFSVSSEIRTQYF